MISLLLIETGGTIGATINDKRDYEFPDFAVHNALVGLGMSFSHTSPFMKDSSIMTDDDREAIYDSIVSSPHSEILITHGTDTMVETAKFLAKKGIRGKRVILTGAFTPLSQHRFDKVSDGYFNLGHAIGELIRDRGTQTYNDIHIAMGGVLYHYSNVRKSFQLQRFERVV